MGYISGMTMGNIIQDFLIDNDLYTPENYRKAYKECKSRCHKITSGSGHATRHMYYAGEVLPILRE